MSPDVQATIFILSSAIMHAISSSLYRMDGDRLVRMVFTAFLALAIMVPVAFFVPLPAPELWWYLFPSAFIIIIYQLVLLKALQYGELSYIYPIARGTAPVFVVLLTILFLNHELLFVEVLGVALVAVGVMELSLRGFKGESIPKDIVRASFYSFLTGLTIATYTLIDAKGIRLVANPFSYVAWLFILVNISMVTIVFYLRAGNIKQSLIDESRRGFIAAFFGIASYITALLALRVGSAVEVAALRETSIMFAILIGYFFLGEGIGIRRLIAVALITLGAVTIKMF